MNRFVFTCGDVNGIGPEIVLKTFNALSSIKDKDRFYFVCPENIFKETTKLVKPEFDYHFIKAPSLMDEKRFNIIIEPDVKQSTGKPTIESGKAAFSSLNASYLLLKNNLADVVITAPISKEGINKAGIKFPGQTEMFAKWTETENYSMVFLSEKFNTALLTIHEPIKNIPRLITVTKIKKSLEVLFNMYRKDLNISNPKIAMLGLNPHAGEKGLIGKEEIEVINPALEKIAGNFPVEGPFVPDAFFANKLYNEYDLTIGMYHDQVLIPFKMINVNAGVNYTAGLPIIRTSPDHGTGFDIAGKGIANEKSMFQAFNYAKLILKNRKKNSGSSRN